MGGSSDFRRGAGIGRDGCEEDAVHVDYGGFDDGMLVRGVGGAFSCLEHDCCYLWRLIDALEGSWLGMVESGIGVLAAAVEDISFV